jgi:hypothetical protein
VNARRKDAKGEAESNTAESFLAPSFCLRFSLMRSPSVFSEIAWVVVVLKLTERYISYHIGTHATSVFSETAYCYFEQIFIFCMSSLSHF